jgi:hypothetical protein
VLGTPEATGFDDSAESCPKRPSPIPEILANIDTSTPSSQIIAAFFSGPVPLPAILRAYNDIVPGSAEKIIANSIAQSQHRQNLEKVRVLGDEWRANMGLYAGSGLAAGCLISGTILGLYGQSWLAGVLFTTTIGSILASLVYSHHQRQAEIAKKAEIKNKLADGTSSPPERPDPTLVPAAK